MDTDLKARWVAALRSGEYKQGKGVLKTEDGRYCCLGVLCDLIDKDGWGDKVKLAPWSKAYGFPHNGSIEMIDNEMRSAIGFHNPMIFSNLNDEGKSFNEIADIIESKDDVNSFDGYK